ncbi:MAG: 16S rRNA (adenine(1518)-N(6)/adenine(1519)-N(6))-dimethyltransferase RsmA [Puniceicoccales bacterium]|jgi:16S rRNA (adenine1518-N6/adenine1519-N6)-dimethyltransferase|nr:16S rRNA (adenine(1518)-N(6)/adenine(1519)-N(6))-dimethyltransferase RsmA [Puniceicoccales bacterium]
MSKAWGLKVKPGDSPAMETMNPKIFYKEINKLSTKPMSLLKQTLLDLENLKIVPSKKLGQNFLVDGNVVDKVMAISDVRNGDVIIEIGPGLGALSEKILKIGAKLFAIELDSRLFNFFKSRFVNYNNLWLMHGNAVDFPTAGLPQNMGNFKVVSNLPYSISSTWISALLECCHLPLSISLITQIETAQRFFASVRTSEICPISIFLQSAYDRVCMHRIAASSFYPEPMVSSAMVSMVRKQNPFLFKPKTKQTIRWVFTKRRKQMGGIGKGGCIELQNWLSECKIATRQRPEEISIQQWKVLDEFF